DLSLPSHKDMYCTVSIGISCAENKESIIEWIKEADEMLYEVKRNGKNGYCMPNN
ncbi:TPA: diguanylate cyclase, partial [Klebsiella pneumoniae subsp. pneumoniae]|nr:diguanylate cyclase [Klebsiella pneumoniae subsp. pneumoniae]